MDNILGNPVPNAINLDGIFEDLNPEYLGLENDVSGFTGSCTISTDQLPDPILHNPTNSILPFNINHAQPEPAKKKRGRKPLRPNDPIKTKTEEKDKFWLRAFRSHIRQFVNQNWEDLKEEERLFWKFYFSANGKPGKKKRFLSYGRLYKAFLFENQFFKTRFKTWFSNEGDRILERKYKPGTNEYFVYYNYCQTELFCYSEEKVLNGVTEPCPEIEMEGCDLLHEDFIL